ncbi:hypothetical protein BS50DRAFT_380698 [Corynespora cassiicola Philippines]|uniref:Uncharacterized protein n=1 Tax=Corynespora cassiicola Philippines TaxID=1448308 RepID=A0A2T2NP65_CORCC|nr:hypothetical protein BS50DRAFT_380698 [Corynespora cassiicola Philippines]
MEFSARSGHRWAGEPFKYLGSGWVKHCGSHGNGGFGGVRAWLSRCRRTGGGVNLSSFSYTFFLSLLSAPSFFCFLFLTIRLTDDGRPLARTL